jgi:OOP family OmpA-OmpF porin
LACLLGGAAYPALSLTFEFPGPAQQTFTTPATVTSYGLPTGPWAAGSTPVRQIEGRQQQTAWQLQTPDLSSLEIISPLRDQLREAGFSIVFECATESCGGFDFRFDAAVLPEPDMHVDLGDFRFVSARREGPEGPEAVSLMVSRSASAGYVQVTTVSPQTSKPALSGGSGGTALMASDADGTLITGAEASVTLSTATNPSLAPDSNGIAARLLTGGAIVLDGLQFATGAADLEEGRYESLAGLAEWLKANPDKTIALVGHTDASGSLDANIAVSRRRAASVRTRLTEAYGIPADQIEAQGVGYLSPRDTNLTEEGRTNNRRVEAILTSTR